MKKIILLTFIIACCLAGTAQSIILNSWRDPNTSIQNPGYHKIVVAALIYDQGVWSANTRTTNPGGRVPLFEDVCNAVRSQMSAEGFLQ